MPELLQDTLEVHVDGETYIFAIPGVADEIKLGLIERDIRRQMELDLFGPTGAVTGEPTGDRGTDFVVRVAAQFRLLLRRGPAWPYSNGVNGEPVVDFTKWPNNKVDTAFRVGMEFQNQLARFRSGGTADQGATGGQALVGQPDTTNQPIRPEPAAA